MRLASTSFADQLLKGEDEQATKAKQLAIEEVDKDDKSTSGSMDLGD